MQSNQPSSKEVEIINSLKSLALHLIYPTDTDQKMVHLKNK
jgi:hypothetical protein